MILHTKTISNHTLTLSLNTLCPAHSQGAPISDRGTRDFMPPEMARRACVCGPPCDVFSSGVTFFFMLQVCAYALCIIRSSSLAACCRTAMSCVFAVFIFHVALLVFPRVFVSLHFVQHVPVSEISRFLPFLFSCSAIRTVGVRSRRVLQPVVAVLLREPGSILDLVLCCFESGFCAVVWGLHLYMNDAACEISSELLISIAMCGFFLC